MGTIIQDFGASASSYNGYTFSAAVLLMSAQHRPQYDAASRVVIGTRHVIRLKDTLQATDQLDGTKVDTTVIRRQLGAPAGQLILNNLGMGNLAVNVAVPPRVVQWDSEWGPLPQLIEWQDAGNGKAGFLIWEVAFTIPEQCANPAYTTSIMEFNYKYLTSKDASGYSRRTLTGKVVIPMTRSSAASRDEPDCVDRLKTTVYPDIPDGFRRTQDDWNVSEDRRTAMFTVVDEEMPPVVPPAHAIFVSASHSVETAQPRNFFQWVGHLEAEYELTRSVPPGDAFKMFGDLVKLRFDHTDKQIHPDPKGGGAFVPLKLQMVEPEIYGRKHARFAVDYTYTLPLPADQKGDSPPAALAQGLQNNVAAASSLWIYQQGRGAVSFSQWANSMKIDGVSTARGLANLFLDPANDALIDLCEPAKAKAVQPASGSKTAQGVKVGASGGDRNRSGGIFGLSYPAAEASWLDFQTDIISDVRHSMAELKPLPPSPVALATASVNVQSQTGYVAPYTNPQPSVLQLRSSPSFDLVFRGMAMRAGYPITPPRLVSYGGVAAVPVREWFHTSIVANFGIPIIAATWYMIYRLVKPPSQGVLPLDNFLMGALPSPPQQTGLTGLISSR